MVGRDTLSTRENTSASMTLSPDEVITVWSLGRWWPRRCGPWRIR